MPRHVRGQVWPGGQVARQGELEAVRACGVLPLGTWPPWPARGRIFGGFANGTYIVVDDGLLILLLLFFPKRSPPFSRRSRLPRLLRPGFCLRLQRGHEFLEILPLAERIEVGVCIHVDGVLVAFGHGITKHRHRLVTVELHLFLAILLTCLVIFLNDRDAQGQGACSVIGIAGWFPVEIA